MGQVEPGSLSASTSKRWVLEFRCQRSLMAPPPGGFSLSFTGQLRTVKGRLHTNKGKMTFDRVADGCPE